MKKRPILIQPLGFEHPVGLAASELAKYLPKIAPVRTRVLKPRGGPATVEEARIVLGTSVHLKELCPGRLPRMSAFDDALAIIPKSDRLFLAGSNPRSVLFAVYRLLEELGAVFLRPGTGGEVMPRLKSLQFPRCAIAEKASYRHRGVCIEGAPRLEHVMGMLDWMAKKKMNTFQLQFLHAGVFWRRGYRSHEMDEAARGMKLSDADCVALDERVIGKVKALGMVLHRVGHGWTARAAGVEGNDWEKVGTRVSPGKKAWLASVGGKREFFMGIRSCTELCYSKPQVREAFVREVVTYARQHSEADVIHVWLSDAMNNKCECRMCAKKSPADWYVMMINSIGKRLKAERLAARVVFLAYVDLILPPEKERVAVDNVIFMYAPVRRCYRHALSDTRCGERFEWVRQPLNAFVEAKGNRPYAAIARMWKKMKLPDTFLFDYHLMWDVWSDGFGKDIGKVMAQDMKDLKSFGLNGLVSVQCIRAFYPMPYLPNAMADTLWNRRLAAGKHRRRITGAAFGRHAREAEEYFARMVRGFRAGNDYEHGTVAAGGAGSEKKLSRLAAFAGKWRKKFKTASKKERDPVLRTSLGLLSVHAEHAGAIARMHLAGSTGDVRRIERLRARYRLRLPAILAEYSPWIDPMVTLPFDVFNVHPKLVGVVDDAVQKALREHEKVKTDAR